MSTAAGVYEWEQAKRPSDSPRAVGALLEPHIRADEDLRERESQLRLEVKEAETAEDPQALCRAHHCLGLQLEIAGSLEAAEKSLSAAVSACSSDASAKEWGAALNDQAVLLLRLGRDSEATDKLEEARSIASAGGWDDIACCVNRNKGLLALTRERREEGLDLLNTAFREGRATDDAVGNGQILNNVAILRLLEGETAEAMQLFNRAILLEQRGGDLRGLAFTYNNLGLVFSGPTRGDHFAAIPFMEMALPLLTGPVDVLGRLYVLNNNILVHEQAHLEPARKLRIQFGETLKSFHSSFPRRALDAERVVYEKQSSESFSESTLDDEWDISPAPVLLRSCSRCGPQEA